MITHTLLVGMYCIVTLETSLAVSLNYLSIYLSYDPATVILGIYPKEMIIIYVYTKSVHNCP